MLFARSNGLPGVRVMMTNVTAVIARIVGMNQSIRLIVNRSIDTSPRMRIYLIAREFVHEACAQHNPCVKTGHARLCYC